MERVIIHDTNTPTEYYSWECKPDTREFHGNEVNLVFSTMVQGQKYHWEVCN